MGINKRNTLSIAVILLLLFSAALMMGFTKIVEATPSVTILSPQNRTYNTKLIYVDVSASDPETGIEWIAIVVDGIENYTIAQGVQPGWHTIAGNTTLVLSDGWHSIIASAGAWLTREVMYSKVKFKVDTASISEQNPQILGPIEVIFVLIAVIAIATIIAVLRKRRY